jgi:anti-sigma-K factor RskA
MNLQRFPHLIDLLAAEHALGLVRGGARRRLDYYAQRDAALRQAIDDWQRRLAPLAEFAPERVPPASVWREIERRIGLQSQPARPVAEPVRWFERLSFWRGWAIGATALAAVAAVVAMRALLPGQPATPAAPTVANVPSAPAAGVAQVAVLDDQDKHPVMLVAWDAAHDAIMVQPLASIAPPEGRAMQLWAVPPQGHPVSLGVLPATGNAKLAAHAQRPDGYAAIAVSIEPPGGSPNPDGPSGPVVYVGKLLPVS